MNRVLVVDDDSGMRTALEARFLHRGWHVETAANAVEALDKFRRREYALIVTDIRIPGADGFTLMRQLRALAPHTAESRLRPGVSLGEMERKLFEMTLESTGGNRSHAAELLGVSLRTVRNKIRSYGLPSWSSYVHD